MVLTTFFTGAREGSVEALNWSDVDLDKKVIRLGRENAAPELPATSRADYGQQSALILGG